MADVSVSKSMRLKRQDAVWLSIALLVHSALLLIPLQRVSTVPESVSEISVELLATRMGKTAAEPGRNTPVDVKKPATEERYPQTETMQQPAEPQPEPARDSAEKEQNLRTTARLLESASRLKWSFPEKSAGRQLGKPPAQTIPDNWRPRISVEDNLFNGMTVPATIEVVDRWLAADGSQNVVINTPGGETLCGRANARDPMNPLIEPVMMYRKCGGGGKRTFKMPDRYMRRLVD